MYMYTLLSLSLTHTHTHTHTHTYTHSHTHTHTHTHRLVSTEEENKQLKIEMSELRARQKIELERVGRLKEKELGDVHERVKQALSKKDDNINSLRQQYEAVLKRADHLEMLLERQRKEILKK